jgi:hypothetical protein
MILFTRLDGRGIGKRLWGGGQTGRRGYTSSQRGRGIGVGVNRGWWVKKGLIGGLELKNRLEVLWGCRR